MGADGTIKKRQNGENMIITSAYKGVPYQRSKRDQTSRSDFAFPGHADADRRDQNVGDDEHCPIDRTDHPLHVGRHVEQIVPDTPARAMAGGGGGTLTQHISQLWQTSRMCDTWCVGIHASQHTNMRGVWASTQVNTRI